MHSMCVCVCERTVRKRQPFQETACITTKESCILYRKRPSVIVTIAFPIHRKKGAFVRFWHVLQNSELTWAKRKSCQIATWFGCALRWTRG